MKGSARAARLSASGASHLKLPEFLLKQTTVGLSGASNARIAVRSEEPFRAQLSGASSLEGSVDAGGVELELDGASHATLRGSAKDTKIKADGASQVAMADFSVDAAKVAIAAGSTSSVELRGKAGSALLEGTGASHLRLAGLVVEEAGVKLSGTSQAAVGVRKSLKYDLSSGSRLDYSGDPPTLTGSKSGGSTIRRQP